MSYCTALDNGEGLAVATVEHVVAAFAGLEIDNVVVELDGPEIPVMDGSAAPFVFLIECAGIVDQDAPRRAIKILKPITIIDGAKSARLVPDDAFSIGFSIDFAANAIRHQSINLVIDPETFKADIARARTFGFLDEVNELRAAGFARGGSLDNAVVIRDGEVMNREGLRYVDEFVRHKVLDAMGDLYLAGAPLIGRFEAVRSGHSLNRRVLAALFADSSAWRMSFMPKIEPAALMWHESVSRARA